MEHSISQAGGQDMSSSAVPAIIVAEPESEAGVGAWLTLWVLVLVTLFAFLDRQMLALVTQPLGTSLRLTDGQLGMIFGLGSAVFAMVATYPLGWLADRYDRRVVLGVCVMIWAGGTAACGFANSYGTLFVAVLALSAGEAVVPPLTYSAIPDLFQGRQRVRANHIFYVASILSGAAGLILGGMASAAVEVSQGFLPQSMHALEPWRALFILVALPAPLLIILIASSQLHRRSTALTNTDSEAVPAAFGHYLAQHGRAIAIIFAALCAYGLPFGAILAWTPAALERLFAANATTTGIGIGIALGGGCVVGVAAAGWLLSRLTPKLGVRASLRIASWTLLGSLPVALFFPFVSNTIQAFASVAFLMLSGTLIGCLLPGIIQGLAPSQFRGRVTAIYSVISVITSGYGITAVGQLSDALASNPRSLLIAVTASLILCWGVGAILLRLAEGPYERTLLAIGDATT
jgi:MFS family permease